MRNCFLFLQFQRRMIVLSFNICLLEYIFTVHVVPYLNCVLKDKFLWILFFDLDSPHFFRVNIFWFQEITIFQQFFTIDSHWLHINILIIGTVIVIIPVEGLIRVIFVLFWRLFLLFLRCIMWLWSFTSFRAANPTGNKRFMHRSVLVLGLLSGRQWFIHGVPHFMSGSPLVIADRARQPIHLIQLELLRELHLGVTPALLVDNLFLPQGAEPLQLLRHQPLRLKFHEAELGHLFYLS